MEPPKEKTLLDWLGYVRDGWKALFVAVAIGLTLAVILTLRQPTEYGATGTVLVSPADGFLDPGGADTLPALTDTVGRLATTPVVLKEATSRFVAAARTPEIARERESLATTAWLTAHLSARQVGTSSILELDGTMSTQAAAVDLTRSFINALTAVVNRETPTKATGGIVLRVFSDAEASGQTSPTPFRNDVLGVIGGGIIGLALAALLGATRRRLRDPREIALAVGAPLLGVVGPGGDGADSAVERLQVLRPKGAVLLTGPLEVAQLARIAQRLATAAAGSSERIAFVKAASIAGSEPMTVHEQSQAGGRLRVIHAAASEEERAEDVTAWATAEGGAAGRGAERGIRRAKATSTQSVRTSQTRRRAAPESVDGKNPPQLVESEEQRRLDRVRARVDRFKAGKDELHPAPSARESAVGKQAQPAAASPEEVEHRLAWLRSKFDHVLIAGNGLDRDLPRLVREVDGIVMVAVLKTPLRDLMSARWLLTDLNREPDGVVVVDRRR